MGAPSKSQHSSESRPSQHSATRQTDYNCQSHDAFPHDYIRSSRYMLPQDEEQTICTVYQKTPLEHRECLRVSLVNYINWRCNGSDGDHHPPEMRVSSNSLHLCTHVSKDSREVDKKVLLEFSDLLENDGITRLDLLWNMKSYRKWFDVSPGAYVDEAPT